MIERALPLLGMADESAPTARLFLVVSPPDACDKAMIRDGIEPKLHRPGMGEKAVWLYQIIARIRPSTWCRIWGRTPADLAEAVAGSQEVDVVYPAIIEAAVLHNDPEWIDALLPHRRKTGNTFNIYATFSNLTEATTRKLILADDDRSRAQPESRALTEEQMNLLHRTDGPWGDELSRLVLARMAVNLGQTRHFHHTLYGLLNAAARCLPPELVLASPPRRTIADSEGNLYVVQQVDRQLEEFHALIQFRHEMIQELRR